MGDPEEKEGEKKKQKPIKLEEVAEETGELVGKCVKKTWGIVKSFGKGLSETLEKKEETKDAETCPHCSAPVTPDSRFCASCGKKL